MRRDPLANITYDDLVALADRLAPRSPDLQRVLRDVRSSRYAVTFMGSYRAPSYRQLLEAVEKAGRDQGLW